MKIFDKKIIIIILFIFIAILAIYFFSKKNTYELYSTNELFIQSDISSTSTESQEIVVHITGEINSPGIVSLTYGSRISDAIEAAGGVTANADTSKINLAFILRRWAKNLCSKYL